MVISDNRNEYEILADKGKLKDLLKLSLKNQGVESRYWELFSLMWMGRSSKANMKCKEYEHLFFEDIWRTRFLHVLGLTHWGHKSNLALDYFKQAFDIAERIDYKEGMADYYLYSGVIMASQKEKGGEDFGKIAFDISKKINYKLGMVRYYVYHGQGLINNLKFEKGLEFIDNAQSLCEEIGNDFYYTQVLTARGRYYYYIGDYDKSLENHQQCYDLSSEVDTWWSIANSLGNIAYIYYIKGMFDKSLDYRQERYNLELKIGHQSRIAGALSSMADIYREKGELDDALDNYEHALKIYEEEEDLMLFTLNKINIGVIQRMRGNEEEALDIFEEVYNIRNDLENPIYLLRPLDNMIPILAKKDRTKAKMYLDIYENIERSNNKDLITKGFDLAKAIYLKSSNRLKDRVLAQIKFEEIIREREKKQLGIMDCIPHLVELLLAEYESSNEEEVMEEIFGYLDNFHNIASEKNMYPALIKSYVIKSQLAHIDGKFSNSEELLDQAASLAVEKNLGALLKEVEMVNDELKSNIERMQQLLNQNADFTEKLKHSNIMLYIKKAQEVIKSDN